MISSATKAILAAFLCAATSQIALPSSNARLEAIPSQSVNVNKLNWRSIPSDWTPIANPKQMFVLRASGVSDLRVIPVEYQNDFPRCGVYFLPQRGSNVFVPVVGEDVYPWSCSGVRAVGTMTDSGPRPRLILIFSAYNGQSSPDDPTPFVLSWDEQRNTYQLDKVQTQWLLDQNAATDTVAQVRRVLAHYHAGQASKHDQ